MRYLGTRGGLERGYSAAEAIRDGLAPGGGLFVPETFPRLSLAEIGGMRELSYEEISLRILKEYLSDYSEEEIGECVEGAYNDATFSHGERTPVVKLEGDLYVMEMWHGPTAAFKDMALQLMPRLFVKAREKTGAMEENLILVATSGDTGKAALEGFKDLPGIGVAVFYPEDGVSQIQKLQMTTTQGENLRVAAVRGNFDDCQRGVKEIFSDEEFKASLKGVALSSANSINLGRLLPQIIYYFKAYTQLLRDGEIELGERVDFCVPTGNFGNILAGYYAREMGLPVGKLICASNRNNVLTDFLRDGVYNKNREFHKTMSPSMDILVSSNLERFLYHILRDSERIGEIYNRFAREGIFSVDEDVAERIREVMDSGYTGEEECLKTIEEVHRRYGYSIDTHTAVAMKVAMEKRERKVVVLSTASIYKFPSSVVKGLGGDTGDEFQEIETLNRITGVEVHRAVEGVDRLPVVHGDCVDRERMREYIEKLVNG